MSGKTLQVATGLRMILRKGFAFQVAGYTRLGLTRLVGPSSCRCPTHQKRRERSANRMAKLIVLYVISVWLLCTALVMQSYMRENQVVRHNSFITVLLLNWLMGIVGIFGVVIQLVRIYVG
jgi:hypothetical protein